MQTRHTVIDCPLGELRRVAEGDNPTGLSAARSERI